MFGGRFSVFVFRFIFFVVLGKVVYFVFEGFEGLVRTFVFLFSRS